MSVLCVVRDMLSLVGDCSGCSAGARGVLFNTHHVLTDLVPAETVSSVAVLLDSAFWVDIPPLVSHGTTFQAAAAQAFTLYNAAATVDPHCLAKYGCVQWPPMPASACFW